ncbi:MAG TPA: RNA polymerase sigma factor [Candidatus Limnocylindrales bacterium]|nr:RNA polymerase sigma factor [Candidatus Limnocylindrales bacterium]
MAFRHEIEDFGPFYERTYPAAFRTALGICGEPSLAADVTQEAYVAAYRQRDRFRGQAPAGAWLQRIVVNAALSGLRRRKVRWTEPLEAGRHDRAGGEGADRLDALALRAALEVLPAKQRAAVVLRYYHDLDYATIARILDTSPGNVGALLSRAVQRLRLEFDGDGPAAAAPLPATREAGHGR